MIAVSYTHLNVGLDLLFVAVFGWGVAGAAVATVIAQGFSALYCLMVLRKMCIRDRLGPQVGYQLARAKEICDPKGVPVDVIPMQDYGTVSYTHLDVYKRQG